MMCYWLVVVVANRATNWKAIIKAFSRPSTYSLLVTTEFIALGGDFRKGCYDSKLAGSSKDKRFNKFKDLLLLCHIRKTADYQGWHGHQWR